MYAKITVGLACALLLNGCILAALNNPNAASMLTPEQIAAYRDMNLDVAFCLQVGGPPPAGNANLVLLPKGSTMLPQFGDGCHIIQGSGIGQVIQITPAALQLAPVSIPPKK